MTQKKYDLKKDERYLRLLAKSFPNIADAATEIINLEAIAHLPKGTEHFLADIHGEYQAFQHVLKNASGNIKRKVNELFGERLRNIEKQELCTLIYYPEQKLELVKKEEKDIKDWYHITIHRLIGYVVMCPANIHAQRFGSLCRMISLISSKSYCTNMQTTKTRPTM